MRIAGQGELQAKFQKELLPWGASIEITSRCNLHCAHCLRGPASPDDGLSYDQVCDLLDQLAELGCLQVTFTGGEPFCRLDFLPILAHARKRGLAAVVLTNGTLITAGIAEALLALQVHRFQVSLYGASARVHEAVTGVSGSFSDTVSGIEVLANRGPSVRVMMPILAQNVQDVGAVRDLCKGLGVEFQRGLLVFPGDDGSTAPLELQAAEEQLCRLADEERKIGLPAGGAGSSLRLPANRPICTAGSQQIAIGPDGSVYPCGALRLSAGNIGQQSLAQIWRDAPVFHQIRRSRPSYAVFCSECPEREGCFWCPGLSLALEGDMTVPNRQDCRRTRIFYGGNNCGNV